MNPNAKKKAKNSKPSAKKKVFNPKAAPTRKFDTRIKTLESKPKEEVKLLFRDYFKQHKTAGHIMSKQDVIVHVIKKLNAKEEDVFDLALNELKNEGFIEKLEDGVSLMLTQKGADSFK